MRCTSLLRRSTLNLGHPSLRSRDIKLLVCDMAGTTVDEGGIVYQALRKAMTTNGLLISEADIHPWHGAEKKAVMSHFVRRHMSLGDSTDLPPEATNLVSQIDKSFLDIVETAYFAPESKMSLISADLPEYLRAVRAAGIKVALNTGYPPHLQKAIMDRLDMHELVDGAISSGDVTAGRPWPYMIHRLVERFHLSSTREVAKAGDSVNDVLEGRNAQCGLTIGVLSGADDAAALQNAGADIIVRDITEVPV
eukprot:TRINITY_DN71805_c0_g1_i1.p1 TRINITY_DN71805_c0_g1~~TRINITY_DN71805_c0_g1_i1.p1  ORF type:complete len:251 (+),score=47.87 TRINITY_DN71805_c0_g1_i1:96-848(+)